MTTALQAKQMDSIEVRFVCDFQKQSCEYICSLNVNNVETDCTAKLESKESTKIFGKTCKNLANFCLLALKRGKLWSEKQRCFLSTKDFDWKIFLWQNFSNLLELPRLDQLSEKFKRFEWSDENFVKFLEQNPDFTEYLWKDVCVVTEVDEEEIETLVTLFDKVGIRYEFEIVQIYLYHLLCKN